jgi:hypothetical protein
MSTLSTTRILHAPAHANALVAHRAWVWPLPRLDGAAPCIIEPAREHPPPDGFAIGYSGRSSSPSLGPVFAAQDGVVTYAISTAGGSALCIDHVGGWSTHYAELEHLLARPTDRFRHRRKERVRAATSSATPVERLCEFASACRTSPMMGASNRIRRRGCLRGRCCPGLSKWRRASSRRVRGEDCDASAP